MTCHPFFGGNRIDPLWGAGMGRKVINDYKCAQLIADLPARCPTGMFQNNENREDGLGLCGCCGKEEFATEKVYGKMFKLFTTCSSAGWSSKLSKKLGTPAWQ